MTNNQLIEVLTEIVTNTDGETYEPITEIMEFKQQLERAGVEYDSRHYIEFLKHLFQRLQDSRIADFIPTVSDIINGALSDAFKPEELHAEEQQRFHRIAKRCFFDSDFKEDPTVSGEFFKLLSGIIGDKIKPEYRNNVIEVTWNFKQALESKRINYHDERYGVFIKILVESLPTDEVENLILNSVKEGFRLERAEPKTQTLILETAKRIFISNGR